MCTATVEITKFERLPKFIRYICTPLPPSHHSYFFIVFTVNARLPSRLGHWQSLMSVFWVISALAPGTIQTRLPSLIISIPQHELFNCFWTTRYVIVLHPSLASTFHFSTFFIYVMITYRIPPDSISFGLISKELNSHTHAHTRALTHKSTHSRAHTHTHTHTHTNAHTHAHAHTLTHTHTRTHTHTHTHTHTLECNAI